MENVENSVLEDSSNAEASVPSSVKENTKPAARVLAHCFLPPQGVRGVRHLKMVPIITEGRQKGE